MEGNIEKEGGWLALPEVYRINPARLKMVIACIQRLLHIRCQTSVCNQLHHAIRKLSLNLCSCIANGRRMLYTFITKQSHLSTTWLGHEGHYTTEITTYRLSNIIYTPWRNAYQEYSGKHHEALTGISGKSTKNHSTNLLGGKRPLGVEAPIALRALTRAQQT